MSDALVMFLFLLAVMLDGLLTRFGLALGLYELNPFARRYMGMAYIVELVVAILYIGFFGLFSRDRSSKAFFVINKAIRFGLIILWFVVVWNFINLIGWMWL